MADPAGPLAATQAQKEVKKRKKLTHDGKNILEDYWKTYPSKSEMPSVQERKILTERVKASPGCEWWSTLNTTGWIRRHLKLESNSRFGSLSEVALQHLKVLVGSQPNPSPEVLATWAALLPGAKLSDVVDWVAYVQELACVSPTEPTSTLPTPPSTATPEPQTASLNTKKQNEIIKPDPLSPELPPPANWSALNSATESNPYSNKDTSPTLLSPLCGTTALPDILEDNLNLKELALQHICTNFAENPENLGFAVSSDLPFSPTSFKIACESFSNKLEELLQILQSED